MTVPPDGAEPMETRPEDALSPERTPHAAGLALSAQLEALLFVAPSPTLIARFAQVLDVDEATVQGALADLSEAYNSDRRGLRIIRKGDRAHLTTAPEAASLVERFLGLDLTARLSAAALETLAVIAYRQPLTRGDIESIRGVNCDGVLRTLIARELIEPVSRLEQPGRPFLYGTTLQFLQYFGLEELNRLPPLPSPDTTDSTNV